MNEYKILKCFRKEKPVSGELPCPATGLTDPIIIKVAGNKDRHKSSHKLDFEPLVSMAHLCFFDMRGCLVDDQKI